jgi:penicillin amidase
VVSEWEQALQPTFVAAAQALAEEIATPGSHADLTPIVAIADPTAKPLVAQMIPLVQDWDGTMASGASDGNPTPAEVTASEAATIMGVWMRRFADRSLGDEFEKLGFSAGSFAQLKLMVRLVQHDPLLKTAIDPATGDSILFDSLDNPQPQSLRFVAAQAILDALDFIVRYPGLGPDPSAWRWGNLHTLTLAFLAPIDALQIPLKDDAMFPQGFPRQGDIGTVDAAGGSIDIGDYSYTHGPAIRFVAELDPKHGPRARNAIPGGEVLDPASPHYRDLMELWRKNQAADLAFSEGDVAASAKAELGKNGDGRVRFSPK